jgi:hypothetical protein
MDWQTVYNPGDTPRRIDLAGHMVGSRSWASADVSLTLVAKDVASRRLLVIETLDPVPGEGLDPVAADAMRQTLLNREAAAAPQTMTMAAKTTARATTTSKTEA